MIVKQNVVAFFVFGEIVASFSTKICSSATVTKREAILFLSLEMNSARISELSYQSNCVKGTTHLGVHAVLLKRSKQGM